MPIEKFKDVTIGGRDFRVGLLTAEVGNWAVLQMSGGKASDFDIFSKIQTQLLNQCSVYREKDGSRIPVRVFDSGRWLCPDLDLEYDLDTVNSLCAEALAFNFDPFFGKMKAQAEALPATTSR